MELSSKERGILLLAARESIRTLFGNAEIPAVDYKVYPNLKLNAGAFVTLKIKNELRGCIGFITSEQPLFETVCEVAKHAAIQDPRFPPLTKNEFGLINIEISVLSSLKKISDYDKIIIGEHGLLVEEGYHRGLLLPQVATENNYSVQQFLTSICMKAGLSPDLWQRKKLNLKVFTAIIFKEERSENDD
ncbi:MAG: AMMECR1 domain-containing protein [Ignavibacteria bacterium RIFOXYB2_FULL_35_12]|nr:MAG: AMMECR1 domain-containing protein [Ignavibacteria bacterium GWA2_36_19]OGU63065.1 MAG: AMMECR1 domain-containing protein [Ignavibacteria bacterium GWF2_35_20]OGU78062.1 MAG: AMMECR1 domain-containing protein [Ignavibacteria bacterium RBG_16_35_7]OGU78636.1 MAG: AMMECR1 domain-containing protein [Ignavibacteria bacterium RIFOXYA2_FULL_35_9]OGU88946.1 MAG: AMMECR1 domain-containing protein [Ignavibacteria bacterium RIFOXYA12_FULL_35_25]OGU94846.1 MAG: AMMECR1 domain-containing protein [I